MRQDRCVTCTIVSFFSHYRCLCMPQLTMHSPVMGAAVNPEAFTQIRAMPPRRITAPDELKAATELTVQSCCIANPNGGKLSALGTSRRRFERSHSNSIHRGMRSTPSLFARGCATTPLPPPLVSCPLMADATQQRTGGWRFLRCMWRTRCNQASTPRLARESVTL
jgi:hypothetical protein